MPQVTSRDGATIAYDQTGAGPAMVLVDGALCSRSFGPMPGLAPLLARHFTVLHYDRRGRGDSTDTLPYALEREVEDLEAVVDAAGGTASVFGESSGAALALEAALRLPGKIRKLAMYEPPYNDDPAARQRWKQYRQQLEALLAEGRRGDAVGLFMLLTGMPPEQLGGMRQHPLWPVFEAVAPTLAYDAAVMGAEAAVPAGRAALAQVPALILTGGASYPFMHASAQALARAIPQAQYRSLEGQSHEIAPGVVAPVLVEFFGARA